MEITGVTYSVSDYEHYNQNGDRNYFEEVIDAMILGEIAGMNETFRSAISNLPRDRKRMTILSLLEKDIKLFNKIKALVDKDINKMEHIKDVVLMLREYVKIADVEKKKYGEVMTPLTLVKEMVNKLPQEVWSNPNLKWLDSCNGTGPFLIMVIYKLMNGLKDWELDDEKRYKHIVENMIYAGELQPKNMFLYMCAVDPFDKYKLNVYTGSFLEKEFNFHMKNIWNVDKFDVIVGNPPYQTTMNDGERGSKTNNLYTKFISTSMNILNDDGYLLYITPKSWMTFKNKLLTEIFFKYQLQYLNIDTAEKYFNVGSKFSWFIIKKSIGEIETEITSVVNESEVESKYNFKCLDLIPNICCNESYSIIDKFINSKKIGVHHSYEFEKRKNINNNNFSNKSDDVYKYKFYHSPSVNVYSKNKFESNGRVVLPMTQNIRKSFFTKDGVTEMFCFYDCDFSKSQSFISYINSKFITFVIYHACKWSGFYSHHILKSIPYIDLSVEITDDNIYKYFNLSENEINLIERVVK